MRYVVYPTPLKLVKVYSVHYQLDLVTPGIIPELANSRKEIRERLKRRMKPWRRPVKAQRFTKRTGEALRGSMLRPT